VLFGGGFGFLVFIMSWVCYGGVMTADAPKTIDKKTLLKLRARFFRALWPALFLLLCAYLLKQAVWGERGVFTWRALHDQVEVLRQENTVFAQKMHRLEAEADRLSGGDPDAIELEIRQNLPVLRPHEYLILLPEDTSQTTAP